MRRRGGDKKKSNESTEVKTKVDEADTGKRSQSKAPETACKAGALAKQRFQGPKKAPTQGFRAKAKAKAAPRRPHEEARRR